MEHTTGIHYISMITFHHTFSRVFADSFSFNKHFTQFSQFWEHLLFLWLVLFLEVTGLNININKKYYCKIEKHIKEAKVTRTITINVK